MLAVGAAEYMAERFLFVRRRRFFSDCIIAARRTERLTDHATIARQASRARPIRPSAAPTAINTVPSGVLVVCMYGASAVGGTVTMGYPPEETAPDDVDDVDDVVVVVDEVVVVVLSVEEEEDEVVVEVVVVESMVDEVVVD